VGPRAGFERGGEEKNSQHLPGLETPIIQPVAQRYTAELSRLKRMWNFVSHNRKFLYQSSAEVKNSWSYTSTPQYVFMA
jgi:hypothetical protein